MSIQKIREALEPFADKAGDYIYEDPAHHGIVLISDLRRARDALALLDGMAGVDERALEAAYRAGVSHVWGGPKEDRARDVTRTIVAAYLAALTETKR